MRRKPRTSRAYLMAEGTHFKSTQKNGRRACRETTHHKETQRNFTATLHGSHTVYTKEHWHLGEGPTCLKCYNTKLKNHVIRSLKNWSQNTQRTPPAFVERASQLNVLAGECCVLQLSCQVRFRCSQMLSHGSDVTKNTASYRSWLFNNQETL